MILCLGTTPATQRVMRFSRLTLDAVNRATVTLDGIAGKSVNVAKVLHALGERPLATGFLGGARGEAIRAAFAARGIESEFVTVAAGTRECVTVIDESAGTHTELVEESAPADPDDFARLLAIVRRRMPGCRAAVMSGTIAPGGPGDLYVLCVRLAHEAGALAIVDAQGPALIATLSAGPDLVKPNRAELAATVGRTLADEPAVLAAMRELAERGACRVVVTAGPEPTLLLDGTQVWRIRSPRLTVRNPTGSGDAFTAGLVWRLVRGDDLGEAGRWGSAAGAANALTWMAGEVSRADVERLAREIEVERL
jgi:1-phosphofructokinase family hexose kinase